MHQSLIHILFIGPTTYVLVFLFFLICFLLWLMLLQFPIYRVSTTRDNDNNNNNNNDDDDDDDHSKYCIHLLKHC